MTLQEAILSGGLSNRTVPSRGYRSISGTRILRPKQYMGMRTTVSVRIIRNKQEAVQTLGLTDEAKAITKATASVRDYVGIRTDSTAVTSGRISVKSRLGISPDARRKLLRVATERIGITDTGSAKVRAYRKVIQTLGIQTERRLVRRFVNIVKSTHHVFRVIQKTTRYKTDQDE